LYQRVSGGKVGQEKERAIEFSKLEVLSAIGAREAREASVIVNLMQYALFAYITPLSLYFSTRILPFLIQLLYFYFLLLILDLPLPRPCHSPKSNSFLLSHPIQLMWEWRNFVTPHNFQTHEITTICSKPAWYILHNHQGRLKVKTVLATIVPQFLTYLSLGLPSLPYNQLNFSHIYPFHNCFFPLPILLHHSFY